jgi:four helix bundle protein
VVFVWILRVADGSRAETQALTLIAADAGIFETQQVYEIVSQTHEIGRMLNGLMRQRRQ